MVDFEWDQWKSWSNLIKHGVDFDTASRAFEDSDRLVLADTKHSELEERFYCIGKVNDRILTVRFVKIPDRIRIIGAGYWRRGRKLYEKTKR